MRRGWTAVLTASVVGLTLATPASAEARSRTVSDPRGDVVSQFEGAIDPAAAPTRAEGDVLAGGVTHRARRVDVAMRYAAMTRTTMETVHQFEIRTNKGRVRRVTVMAGPGNWGGRTYVTDGRGRDVRCRTTTALDYVQRRAHVSVARRCLGFPRWVRVAMTSVTMEAGTYFYDDGQSAAPRLPRTTSVLGPRVRRG